MFPSSNHPRSTAYRRKTQARDSIDSRLDNSGYPEILNLTPKLVELDTAHAGGLSLWG